MEVESLNIPQKKERYTVDFHVLSHFTEYYITH